MDGSGDLTQTIKSLLEANQTQTASFASFTVGNSLALKDITLSFGSAQGSGDNWTGSVSVTADTAALTLGTGLSATIDAGSGVGPGFKGTYTLSNAGLASGAYVFSAGHFNLTVPNVFQANATGVQVSYDPTKSSGQDLVKIDSLQASISPLNNVVATLSNLDIRDDGFSLGDGTVSTDTINLGGILQATSPSVGFSKIAYTTGASLTGTITAKADATSLFAGDAGFSHGGAASTNGLTLTKFLGTYDLASNALTLKADGAHLGLGKIIAADATQVAIAYDPAGASPVTVTAGSLMATSPLLPGVTGTITNLKVSSTGVSFDAATLADANPLSLANVVQATGLTAKVKTFNYVAGSPTISGVVSITSDSASLFPGQTSFVAGVTGLGGSYDLGSNALTLTADQVDLAFGKVIKAHASGVFIGWDGTNANVALAGATLSSPLFPGATGTLQGVTADNTGLSIKSAELVAAQITIGSALDLNDFRIKVTDFSYQIGPPSHLTGAITVSAGTGTLFSGQSTFHATVNGFSGSYNLTTSALGLAAKEVQVSIGKILELDATELTLTYDPDASPAVAFHAGSFLLTSPQIAQVSASGTSFDISSNGFSLGSAKLTYGGTIQLGSVLSLNNPFIAVKGLAYTRGAGSLTLDGPIQVGATGDISLAFGSGAIQSKVTNFLGTYDANTQALSLSADSAMLKVGEALEVDIDKLAFNVASTDNGFQVALSVEQATVNLPKLGLSAVVSDLDVDGDGFSFGSLTLATTQTVKVGSVVQVVAPSVHLTGFVYSKSAGGHLDDIGFAADGILVAAGSAAKVTGQGITGTVSLQADSLGHVTLSASSVVVALGTFLKLDATKVAFDSAPAAGGNIVSFGSVGATFLLPGGLSLGGSGSNFAIRDDGKLVPGSNFDVSLTTTDAGNFQWPSWLPIQIQFLKLQWDSFTDHPESFTIDLSATVSSPKPIAGNLNFTGFVNHAVIDVGLLEARQFPIISLGGAGIGVSGTLFGATVKGALFVDLLKVDANGNAIADGDKTPVANRIFYGGIDAGINIAGEAGFEIRLGLSQLGPLDGFVQVEAPIILDPISGLAITNLHAGIDFNRTLPTITDAKALATNMGLKPPGDQTLLQWQTQLKAQVLAQSKAVQAAGDPFAYLTQPMTIDGGATLYSAYATTEAFELDGDLQISTDGKLLLSGKLILGTKITINAAAYLDLSQASQGKANLLIYAQAPADLPILSMYGQVSFAYAKATANTTFSLKINGEIDLTVPQGSRRAVRTGSVTLTASVGASTLLDLKVLGTMGIKPLGDLINVSGDVMLDMTSLASPLLYGGLVVNVGDLSILKNLGLDLAGLAVLRFNTSATDQSVTLPSPTGDVKLTLPKSSGSLYVAGTASFTRGGQTWFDIEGKFYASFGTTTTGQPGPELDLFAAGTVHLGPKGNSLVNLDAKAFLQITGAGIAASFDTKLQQSPILSKAHIDLSGSLTFLINTTGRDVLFTAPSASDLGSGLSTNGTGTPVPIPAAAPGSGTNVAAPYLEIDGSGGLNLFNGLTSSGKFYLLVSPGLLTLGLDEDLKLSIASANLLTLHARGGLTINSAGVYGAIQITRSGDNTANFGFSFDASFLLELNSTGQAQVVATPGGPINLPANLLGRIDAQGHLKIGVLDIQGSFDFQGTTNSVSLAVAGSTQIGPLLNLAVGGQVIFQTGGIVGLLQAGFSIPPVFSGSRSRPSSSSRSTPPASPSR